MSKYLLLPSEDAGEDAIIFAENSLGFGQDSAHKEHPLELLPTEYLSDGLCSLLWIASCPQHAELTVLHTHASKLMLLCQVQQCSKVLTPPWGLELTKVAFCLNTLSLSGVKNKACQSLTACREKDINYSRRRVERSCREWEVLLLSCHLLCATGGALLWLVHRAEVGPGTCEIAGQEEPAQGLHCCHQHPHQQQHPCLQTEPLWGSAQGQGGKAEEWAAEAAAREEIVQGPKTRSIAKYLCTWDFSYRDKVCR